MTLTDAQTCATTALTQLNGHSQRCASPFCKVAVVNAPRGKHGRYCSSRCRMDGYVIRRAKEMMDQVGVIEFVDILGRCEEK
jgi:hypothetical protein